MNTLGKPFRTALTVFTAVVLATSSATFAEEPPTEAQAAPPTSASAPLPSSDSVMDPGIMAADALVVRPAGVAATAVGAAIFLVALPFAAITGSVKRTADTLMGQPARFTFKRHLGDFD